MFFTLRHFLRTVNWKVLWETKTVVLWSYLQKNFAFCPFQSLTASLLIYFHCSGISFTCNLLHFFCFTEDNGVSKWQTTPLHIEKHMESARYMWRIMLESRADVRNVKPLKIWWDRKRVDTERGEKECSAYRMAITSDTLWISPGWAGPLPRGRHKMSLSMSHSEPLNLKERERERERESMHLQWAERKLMDGGLKVRRLHLEKGRTEKERKWDKKWARCCPVCLVSYSCIAHSFLARPKWSEAMQ